MLWLALLLASPLEAELQAAAPELAPRVLALALDAQAAVRATGRGERERLTIVDYSRPSTEPRLWVFDLRQRALLFRELVAHGRGSDRDGEAVRFSNAAKSHASSLGLFETGAIYRGKHGASLKLRGLEPGFNDNASARAIVIHGADYVGASFAKTHGRLGRSHGCPAVRPEIVAKLISAIEGGSLLFVYYPDRDWLARSKLLTSSRRAAP